MADRNRFPALAAHYLHLAPTLKAKAREMGYALGVHGSLSTDMDLIAVPWVEDAKTAEELIEALRECVGGYFLKEYPSCKGCADNGIQINCEHVRGMVGFSVRPHGRRAWSIYFDKHGGTPYLDVSVMPLAPKTENPPTE